MAADHAAGEFKAGDIVGDAYEVISFIGAGAMGNVYHVRHTIMQQEYALKTLSAEHVTEVAWRRFQNEAQAIARMSHANVVTIFNLGFHQGHLPYYVMDLLDGISLQDILKDKGKLSITEALPIFLEACAGIGYAHKKGIVHRDIKPGNIVILNNPTTPGARVKIVDFGIAKLSYTRDQANQQLTAMGEVCGSPLYMSPEQCQGEKIGARSDIYSLGCTIFETLTGRPPFHGRNAMETMYAHTTAPPPSLQSVSSEQNFPFRMEATMAKMLAKAPMDRYQNMESLANDLRLVLDGPDDDAHENDNKRARARSSPIAWMLSAVVLMLLIFGGIIGANSLLQKSKPAAKEAVKRPSTDTAQPIATTSSVTTHSSSFDTTPFLQSSKTAFGKGPIVLKFPKDVYLGQIWSNAAPNKEKDCRDQVTVPFGGLFFRPSGTCIKEPRYFDRFDIPLLQGIQFDGLKLETLKTSDLAFLPRLKGLVSVNFTGCDEIDDGVMNYVEKLPILISFCCNDSTISSERIGKSSILPQLQQLTITGTSDIHAILEGLKNSSKIMFLDTGSASLSDSDYKLLSTMPYLNALKCNGSATTDKQLAMLLPLKHLRALEVKKCLLTPAAAPILSKLLRDKTQQLWIGSPNLSRLDIDRMKPLMPHCTIINQQEVDQK